MTKGMRWRIVTLQAILVIALGVTSGIAFWASGFATTFVHEQLVAQKIYFPDKDQIKTGGALDPAVFPAEIRAYAGTQVDSGDKARVYANDFIRIHLSKVANGQTYSQVSTAAQADPTNAKLAAQKTTLFQGEMLRTSLLNAWGWSLVGTYTGYAAWALLAAALAVLAALVFELFIARDTVEAVKPRAINSKAA